MDMDEKIKFMQTIVARVNGRAKIVAGAGTNCTASTIDLVKKIDRKSTRLNSSHRL